VILDTHVLLWWALDSARLSPAARRVLTDGRVRLSWSVASTWELAIKVGNGRLRLPEPVDAWVTSRLATQGIDTLRIEHAHAAHVALLPPHHRDPFDRLLVAQARIERLPILTADPAIARYDVEVVW